VETSFDRSMPVISAPKAGLVGMTFMMVIAF
jgi:hypothetical protein